MSSVPQAPSAIDWSGVGILSVNGSAICSAIAIGPRVMLTAAHCVAPSGPSSLSQEVSALLRSVTSGETVTVTAAAVIPFPTYQAAHLGGDVAVVLLNETLPSWVATYGIYQLSDELGQVFDAAGFGGATIPGFHSYRNRFENGGLYWTSDWLSFDLDTGLDANNALADFGPSDLGVAGEGMIVLGDSGGPALINGMVAGIPSGLWSTYQSSSRSGQLGFMVRVSQYRDWILATAAAGLIPSGPGGPSIEVASSTAVPEPSTWALSAGAAALLAWVQRRRRAGPSSGSRPFRG